MYRIKVKERTGYCEIKTDGSINSLKESKKYVSELMTEAMRCRTSKILLTKSDLEANLTLGDVIEIVQFAVSSGYHELGLTVSLFHDSCDSCRHLDKVVRMRPSVAEKLRLFTDRRDAVGWLKEK